MPETQWMTLTETADMMKTLPDRVTQMCEDGKLEYYMEDGRYFVSRESIDLFMHPPIDQPATVNPDSNGTLRRQYGRAPQDIEPSPESAIDTQAVNDPDVVAAADGSVPEDNMEEAPGRDMEETNGRGVEVVETAEDAETAEDEEPAVFAQPADEPAVTEDLAESEVVQPAEDSADTEGAVDAEAAQPVDDLAVTDHEETVEDPVEAEEDLVEAEEDLVEAAEDSGEPDVRVAEILADLRAALSRHAREHKAFCDEIAALADALESTLSRDDDKTSELTREISSLLARYTRR
ncbi:MAG: hypothetical protein F4Z29_06205 [Gemmatimonadetes bacterium]|nr:hypothetical protein [Gemmatimonadota bacterium]